MCWEKLSYLAARLLLCMLLAAPVAAQTIVGVSSGGTTTPVTSVGESEITSRLLPDQFNIVARAMVRERSRLKEAILRGMATSVNERELGLFSAYNRYLIWNDPWALRETKRVVEARRTPEPDRDSLLMAALTLWGYNGSSGVATISGYSHTRAQLAVEVESKVDRARAPEATDRDHQVAAAMILQLVRLDCADWNIRNVRVTSGPELIDRGADKIPRRFILAKVEVGHDRTRNVGFPYGRATMPLRVVVCSDPGPPEGLEGVTSAGFWLEELPGNGPLDREFRPPRR
jgi:hypothetical protein